MLNPSFLHYNYEHCENEKTSGAFLDGICFYISEILLAVGETAIGLATLTTSNFSGSFSAISECYSMIYCAWIWVAI